MTSTDIVSVRSGVEGTVVAIPRGKGSEVAASATIVVVELMKLEQPIVAPDAGVVTEVLVEVGDSVEVGQVVAHIDMEGIATFADDPDEPADVREDLLALRERLHLTGDEARPEAVARRRSTGSRTARENVADLLDGGSFVEYGALAHAAQRNRRDAQELRRRTPADGIITGIGTIDGTRVAVALYDETVLAGTQGHTGHAKLDRILRVAHDQQLPFILYAEGGGGRPGDTDVLGGAYLGVPTFRLFAQLSGRVPVLAVAHGLTFAGNTALAGCADVIVATEGAVLGMAGPAMVAGGGLGEYEPDELGPVDIHRQTGAVDVVVADEAAATATIRQLLGLLTGQRTEDVETHEQDLLRRIIPQDAKRTHDADRLLEVLLDIGSAVELRPDSARGMRTLLARIGGRPVGVVANDPIHLAGAIDGEGAESAARFLQLCDAHGVPVVSLVDTPGFMVGPESDADAAVRRTSRLFLAGANLRVPLVAVVVRRAFGLGAMAMVGGDLQAPMATFAWPSATLGPMGLEGAVRLGARRELDQIDDPDEREERVAAMVAAAREHASALNIATFAELDAVIDPADTRARVSAVLSTARGSDGPTHAHVPSW